MSSNDKCFECGSTNVTIGGSVLRCFACGWNYLNKYPCRICGGPSVSFAGYSPGKSTLYGCKEHPITKDERRSLFSSFISRAAK